MKYQRKPKGKKTMILVSSIVALIVIAFLIYFFLFRNTPVSQPAGDTSSGTRSTNNVDYSGPSSEDTSSNQNGKKNSESNSAQGSNTQMNNVEVGVTFADVIEPNLEVRAFTPSVIEGDGTCTAVLIKDGETVKGSSLAFIDASSSQCRPIDINVTQFPSKGIWSLTVEYSSSTHKGVSDPVKVTI